jgi:uncharacterized protein YqjF (DUF2071 family)
VTVRVGDEMDPTALEVWLTARWGAHTRKAGRTWWVPNAHVQRSLRAAEIVELEDDLLPASGVTPCGETAARVVLNRRARAFGRATKVE